MGLELVEDLMRIVDNYVFEAAWGSTSDPYTGLSYGTDEAIRVELCITDMIFACHEQYKFTPEIREWMDEQRGYRLFYAPVVHKFIVRFEHDSDAVMFKLRWWDDLRG